MIRSTEEKMVKKAAVLAGALPPRTTLDRGVEWSRTLGALQ